MQLHHAFSDDKTDPERENNSVPGNVFVSVTVPVTGFPGEGF